MLVATRVVSKKKSTSIRSWRNLVTNPFATLIHYVKVSVLLVACTSNAAFASPEYLRVALFESHPSASVVQVKGPFFLNGEKTISIPGGIWELHAQKDAVVFQRAEKVSGDKIGSPLVVRGK